MALPMMVLSAGPPTQALHGEAGIGQEVVLAEAGDCVSCSPGRLGGPGHVHSHGFMHGLGPPRAPGLARVGAGRAVQVVARAQAQSAFAGLVAMLTGACRLSQARKTHQRLHGQVSIRIDADYRRRHQRSSVICGDGRQRWTPTPVSRPLKAPLNFGVSPQEGNPHVCTLIYLHGFCAAATEYLDGDSELRYPWRLGEDYAPGLRVVLPNAPRLLQPWGESRTAWYKYASKRSNSIGDATSLVRTRQRLLELLEFEIEHLGDARRVFLGGFSQGCTTALDLYLREASRLGLGGFVGSVGFLPRDTMGFYGANTALEALLADDVQACKPVWLQCATDDDCDVPWRTAWRSLHDARGNLPGLVLRKVCGRGHHIDDWEADLINEFLHKHASDAYF